MSPLKSEIKQKYQTLALSSHIDGSADKESTCNIGDMGDLGLVPGSGRPPGGGHGNLLSILAWKIPWTEKPSRLQSTGSSRVRHDLSNLAGTHRALFSQPLPSAAADCLLEGTKALNRHLSYQRENSLWGLTHSSDFGSEALPWCRLSNEGGALGT